MLTGLNFSSSALLLHISSKYFKDTGMAHIFKFGMKLLEKITRSLMTASALFFNGIAQALGGWVRVSEVLFGIWAASRLFAMIAGLTRIYALMRQIAVLRAATGIAGPGGGLLGGAGTAAGAARSITLLRPSKQTVDTGAPTPYCSAIASRRSRPRYGTERLSRTMLTASRESR